MNGFTEEVKKEILERDNNRCIFCWSEPNDIDHAFRRSSYVPHRHEEWNGNTVCRKCHNHITSPRNQAHWVKYLHGMSKALHRAYDAMERDEYQHIYKAYKSKRKRYEELYPGS